MYNKLLERQINRFLKNKSFDSSELKPFLDAISLSYDHYEQDHVLSQRSLEISSKEQYLYTVKIQEREEKIRAILEAASDGIIVVNPANKIEIYNPIASQILKIDKTIVSAFDLGSIQIGLHDSFGALTNEVMSLADFLSKAKKFTLYEISIFHSDGTMFTIELSTSEIGLETGKFRICILRDIFRRKELERKITIRMEITHILLESSSLDLALPQIVSKMSTQFGWDIGRFWLKDPQSMEMQLAYTSLVESTPALIEFVRSYRHMVFLPSIESSQNCPSSNEPYFSNQFQKEFQEGEHELNKFGLSSYLGVPVAFKKNTFGIIEFFSRKWMEKDEQLMLVFSDIGTELAMFTERQQAVARELELQKQLVEAAREAGKSQIATTVLHNVGNALNTLNTSICILNDNFKNSELDNLPKVAELFSSHSHNLPSFLMHDPKGKHLPDYITALSKWWCEEKVKCMFEFEKITLNIDHIKGVISSQQRFCSIAGVKDKITPNQLLDDIITLKAKDCSIASIEVIKQYSGLPLVEIDKVKFLQILYNLFCNAIEAVSLVSWSKLITVKTEVFENNKIRIFIIDNGCGIDPKDLIKIFTYGFSTKKDGHGFGLHSSSILAGEMNGNLQVNSLGLGKGAEFVLTIPIN